VTSASVELSGVTVSFGGRPAVEGVDLAVRPGEIVVLLGPSGCGKSTLLRALAGLQPVGAGRLRVDGEDVAGPSARRAMVFQDDALLPWRSVARNVELPLAVRGTPRAPRRRLAGELIEAVGLAGYEHHLPRQLSGGMRQRVQLARTLVRSPGVILMDEPFASLDAQTRASMQRLLVRVLEQRPATVVFVTHDVDEALLLGDRIVVLTARPGRVRTVVEVPRPRAPGARFSPDFARLRYEILAALGSGDTSDFPVRAHEKDAS